jgi:N-acetylneuraminic acid mutarotase
MRNVGQNALPIQVRTTRKVADFVRETRSMSMLVIAIVALMGSSIPMVAIALPVAADSPWQQAAQMREAKDDFGTVVVGGLIYAVGGQAGPDPTYVDDLQVYDPEENLWQLLTPMPTAEGAVRAAAVDRIIYVLTFGANMFAYDIDAGTWEDREPFPDRLLVPDMIAVGNEIFVFGGFSPSGGVGGVPSDVVYVYDVPSDSWSQRSPMPTARSHHSAVYLDGFIYVLGGSNERNALSVVEIYDPERDEWQSATSMPAVMENFGAVAWNGQIHALFHHEHFVYDPETGEWTEAPPMITPRHGFGAAIVDGTIYIFGGCYEEPRFNTPHNETLFLGDLSEDSSQVGTNVVVILFTGMILFSLVIMYVIRLSRRSQRTA